MTISSNCKESVAAGPSKNIRPKFLFVVLAVFVFMLGFAPGLSILHVGKRASTNTAAANTGARPGINQSAPEGGGDCGEEVENCSYKAFPAVAPEFLRAGGNGDFKIETQEGCTLDAALFKARTFDPWLDDPPNSPKIVQDLDGNLRVEYKVEENTGRRREGTIEVRRGAVLVTCHKVPQEGCTYPLSSRLNNIPAGGGGGEFTVTPSPSSRCKFRVKNNDPDLISGIIDGEYEGTTRFTYSVSRNDTNEIREGTITISDNEGEVDTHTVKQEAGTDPPPPPPPPGDPCASYPIVPISASISSQGGEKSFEVQAPAGCNWVARSVTFWIKADATGNGPGVVNYLVDPNSDIVPRIGGTIRVQDLTGKIINTHTVFQEGVPNNPGDPCSSYPLEPQSVTISSQGGERSFEVQASAGCDWTAKNAGDSPWISADASGRGRGVVTYQVDRNRSTTARPGSIIVRDGRDRIVSVHDVRQSGAPPDTDPVCNLTISPDKTLVGEGGGTFTFMLKGTRNASCSLTARSDKSWIPDEKIIVKQKEVIFTVDEYVNADTNEREGTITIAGQKHTIIQSAGTAKLRACDDPPSVDLNRVVFGTLSGATNRRDCTNPKKSAFFIDRYRLTITEKSRIAVNVAALDFDPTITLFAGTEKIDDDGSGFRNARVPRLPRKEEFIPLNAGEYTIEISSFDADKIGSYALYVASAGESMEPVILGATIEGKTLLVIGENFDRKAKLFIGDSTDPEPNTKNAQSRTRTALIALRSGSKVKREAPVILRVENNSGKESAGFAFPASP